MLPSFLNYYNARRPHSALGYKPPASRLAGNNLLQLNIAARSLVSFAPSDRQSLARIFLTGLLSNVLNPKPGLFVLAFIPQFVSATRGSIEVQTLTYGGIFAVLTAIIFTMLGGFSAKLSVWISPRPQTLASINVGAGMTFIRRTLDPGARSPQVKAAARR